MVILCIYGKPRPAVRRRSSVHSPGLRPNSSASAPLASSNAIVSALISCSATGYGAWLRCSVDAWLAAMARYSRKCGQAQFEYGESSRGTAGSFQADDLHLGNTNRTATVTAIDMRQNYRNYLGCNCQFYTIGESFSASIGPIKIYP